MNDAKQKMLEVLQNNKGFIHPEKWIDYGLLHNFRRVEAEELYECPDCRCGSLAAIGQYVYYSTLVGLRECTQCGLLFSDKRIDSRVIQSHFEQTYKEETYFRNSRRRIFEQIAALADLAAEPGANTLDIGGAKGHLLVTLRKRRPDLHFVLNDLSKEACSYAAETYGFRTLCGDVNALKASLDKYDLIIMSDVIYLVPELDEYWTSVASLASRNGVVIIRVPNRYVLIRLWQFMIRLVNGWTQPEMQDHIAFFNPEHLYVFSRRYLATRLKRLGFDQVTTMPSELLVKTQGDFWHRLYFFLCQIVSKLSCGKWILTPSLLLIAKHDDRNDDGRNLNGEIAVKRHSLDEDPKRRRDMR
jgi:2-polyprenyl-3-methyl-5-hydroxy-6-metoxy-1,4-benzoquinol methylase